MERLSIACTVAVSSKREIFRLRGSSGGIQTTTSPRFRRITPWARACSQTSTSQKPAVDLLQLDPDHQPAPPDLFDVPVLRDPLEARPETSGIRACAFASVDSRSSASDSSPTAQASGFAVYVWP